MSKFVVDYYETYTKSYEIEANSKEEAEEEVRCGIQEGELDPPLNCSDSWFETEEVTATSYAENKLFSINELNLMYAALMEYGNTLSNMAKNLPNESEIMDLLSKKAKESWDMAVKITSYIDK